MNTKMLVGKFEIQYNEKFVLKICPKLFSNLNKYTINILSYDH